MYDKVTIEPTLFEPTLHQTPPPQVPHVPLWPALPTAKLPHPNNPQTPTTLTPA